MERSSLKSSSNSNSPPHSSREVSRSQSQEQIPEDSLLYAPPPGAQGTHGAPHLRNVKVSPPTAPEGLAKFKSELDAFKYDPNFQIPTAQAPQASFKTQTEAAGSAASWAYGVSFLLAMVASKFAALAESKDTVGKIGSNVYVAVASLLNTLIAGTVAGVAGKNIGTYVSLDQKNSSNWNTAFTSFLACKITCDQKGADKYLKVMNDEVNEIITRMENLKDPKTGGNAFSTQTIAVLRAFGRDFVGNLSFFSFSFAYLVPGGLQGVWRKYVPQWFSQPTPMPVKATIQALDAATTGLFGFLGSFGTVFFRNIIISKIQNVAPPVEGAHSEPIRVTNQATAAAKLAESYQKRKNLLDRRDYCRNQLQELEKLTVNLEEAAVRSGLIADFETEVADIEARLKECKKETGVLKAEFKAASTTAGRNNAGIWKTMLVTHFGRKDPAVKGIPEDLQGMPIVLRTWLKVAYVYALFSPFAFYLEDLAIRFSHTMPFPWDTPPPSQHPGAGSDIPLAAFAGNISEEAAKHFGTVSETIGRATCFGFPLIFHWLSTMVGAFVAEPIVGTAVQVPVRLVQRLYSWVVGSPEDSNADDDVEGVEVKDVADTNWGEDNPVKKTALAMQVLNSQGVTYEEQIKAIKAGGLPVINLDDDDS